MAVEWQVAEERRVRDREKGATATGDAFEQPLKQSSGTSIRCQVEYRVCASLSTLDPAIDRERSLHPLAIFLPVVHGGTERLPRGCSIARATSRRKPPIDISSLARPSFAGLLSNER